MAIFINGHKYPNYDVGPGLIISTNVSDGLNASGEFVGRRVGRDKDKIDGLQWSRLDAKTWAAILKEFEEFVVIVKFPDMRTCGWRTERMYPGDRTANPVEEDPETGLPTMYKNCKVNLIDCGEL